jgi:hypothetical protein
MRNLILVRYVTLANTQHSKLTDTLGSLFTHWIADSLTLWKSPVTDEHLWTAASYYSIIAKGPIEILYILTAVVALGVMTILWSLWDGEAGNLMFDGGSICETLLIVLFREIDLEKSVLFGTTILMYHNSVMPSSLSIPNVTQLNVTAPQISLRDLHRCQFTS